MVTTTTTTTTTTTSMDSMETASTSTTSTTAATGKRKIIVNGHNDKLDHDDDVDNCNKRTKATTTSTTSTMTTTMTVIADKEEKEGKEKMNHPGNKKKQKKKAVVTLNDFRSLDVAHPYGVLPGGNRFFSFASASTSSPASDSLPSSSSKEQQQQQQQEGTMKKSTKVITNTIMGMKQEEVLLSASLWQTVLSYCDAISLGQVIQTSRYLYVIGHEPELWRDLVLRQKQYEKNIQQQQQQTKKKMMMSTTTKDDDIDNNDDTSKKNDTTTNITYAKNSWKDTYVYLFVLKNNNKKKQQQNSSLSSSSSSSSTSSPSSSSSSFPFTFQPHIPISMPGIFSDELYRSHLCRSFAIPSQWLHDDDDEYDKYDDDDDDDDKNSCNTSTSDEKERGKEINYQQNRTEDRIDDSSIISSLSSTPSHKVPSILWNKLTPELFFEHFERPNRPVVVRRAVAAANNDDEGGGQQQQGQRRRRRRRKQRRGGKGGGTTRTRATITSSLIDEWHNPTKMKKKSDDDDTDQVDDTNNKNNDDDDDDTTTIFFRSTSGTAPLSANFTLSAYQQYCDTFQNQQNHHHQHHNQHNLLEESPLYLFDRQAFTYYPKWKNIFFPKFYQQCPYWDPTLLRSNVNHADVTAKETRMHEGRNNNLASSDTTSSSSSDDSSTFQTSMYGHDLFQYLGDEQRPDHTWLIMGPKRSGSVFHIDPNCTHAWNACLEGRKRWIFYPPGISPPGVFPSSDGDEVTVPLSVGEWLLQYWNDHMKLIKQQQQQRNQNHHTIMECTVHPGDVIYVPHGWWHMVINLDEWNVAITHNYVSPSNLHNVLKFLREKQGQISGCRDRRESIKPEYLYDAFVSALRRYEPSYLQRAIQTTLEKGWTCNAWNEDNTSKKTEREKKDETKRLTKQGTINNTNEEKKNDNNNNNNNSTDETIDSEKTNSHITTTTTSTTSVMSKAGNVSGFTFSFL